MAISSVALIQNRQKRIMANRKAMADLVEIEKFMTYYQTSDASILDIDVVYDFGSLYLPQDKQAQAQYLQTLTQLGVNDRVSNIQEIYSLSEAQALEYIAKMDARKEPELLENLSDVNAHKFALHRASQ